MGALHDSCVNQESLCFCEVPTQPNSKQEHYAGHCENLLGCSKAPLGCSQAWQQQVLWQLDMCPAVLAWQV